MLPVCFGPVRFVSPAHVVCGAWTERSTCPDIALLPREQAGSAVRTGRLKAASHLPNPPVLLLWLRGGSPQHGPVTLPVLALCHPPGEQRGISLQVNLASELTPVGTVKIL